MSQAFLDANVILRFLTNDPKEEGGKCRELLERAAAGDLTLWLTSLTVAEVVWVLERVYQWPKAEVGTRVSALIGLTGLVVPEAPMLSEALQAYRKQNVDFADGYLWAMARANKVSDVYSYDKHLNRLPGIRRRDP